MVSEFQLLVCILTAAIFTQCAARAQTPYIVLHPADTNVARFSTIPLSCVAASNNTDSPVTIQWIKNDSTVMTAVEIPPVTENYTLPNGTVFYISTVLLCNADFEDTGKYICSLPDSGSRESVLISVYVRTSARFQLHLTGVNHCGHWINDISNDIQDVITHLRTYILDSICTAPSNDCSYDIINPSFNCMFTVNSDSVMFSAVLEYQARSEASSYQQASDIVSTIGAWKDQGRRVLTVNSLELSVESDCDIASVVPCGERPDVTFGEAKSDSDLAIVASILGITIFLTGAMFVVIIVLIVKIHAFNKERQNEKCKRSLELSTLEPNLAYGDVTNREGTILTKNDAYCPTTSASEVANDHSTYYESVDCN